MTQKYPKTAETCVCVNYTVSLELVLDVLGAGKRLSFPLFLALLVSILHEGQRPSPSGPIAMIYRSDWLTLRTPCPAAASLEPAVASHLSDPLWCWTH